MAKSKTNKNQVMGNILKQAVKLISKPKGWGTLYEAVNAGGRECEVYDKEACRFCAVGSVRRAIYDVKGKYDFSLFNDIHYILNEETKRATKYVDGQYNGERYVPTKGYDDVIDFNDIYAKKDKRYVIRLLNRVIDGLRTSK